MSRSIGKQAFIKAIAKRNYSAAPLAKANTQSIQTGENEKKVKLVAVNEDSPLATIKFTFRAGSRYENAYKLGITHIIRKSVGLSTLDCFPFNIQRNAQRYGFNFYTTVDRETFSVTIQTLPCNIPLAFDYANSCSTRPAFKYFEIADNRKHIKVDALSTPIQVKLLDSLHKEAYRTGLGNPLTIHESQISKIDNEDLLSFYGELCTNPRLQITTSGVSLSQLQEYAVDVDCDEDSAGPNPEPAKYFGGESRYLDYQEGNVYVAVAGETPGFTKKEYLPYAVLKHVYSNTPSSHCPGQSILNKSLSKSGALAAVTGFNASYSDSGLVGFYLVADASDGAKAVDSVMTAFVKANITDQDVNRAKNQLKLSISENLNGSKLIDFLASQVGQSNFVTPEQLMSSIDSVTTADVKQAAKKIIDGKLSAAVYGNILKLPHIDAYTK